MSAFCNGIVYVIVPALSVTQAMINSMRQDFNATQDSIRKSNNLLLVKWLFKVRMPVHPAFDGYKWYTHEEIVAEMENNEWQ